MLRGLDAVGTVGIHGPHLGIAVGIGIEEGYFVAAGYPYGRAFAFWSIGDFDGRILAAYGHKIEIVIGVVFGQIFI